MTGLRSVNGFIDSDSLQNSAANEAPLFLIDPGHGHQKKSLFSMPVMLFFGLMIFIIWAAVFEIDQSVRASGSIIPGDRTQIIQAVDGGVLAEILVQEGESVVAGQLLVVLEKKRINATFEESRSKVAALSAALVRTRAEVSDEELIFGEEFNDFQIFVEAQKNLYQQRKQALQDELSTLESGLDMAQAVLNVQQNLLASGSTSELEVMSARQKVNEEQGRITNTHNKYLSETLQETAKLEADLDVAKHKQDERQSVLESTDVKAPVAGIVKYIKFNTLGGVLRSGDELMQISPTDNDMVVEVKISPVDIGQLSLGMPVTVKVDAFDYSIYGNLKGSLTYISSDTLVENINDDTVTYYRAQVVLGDESKNENKKLSNADLKPGMTTSIDIQTNKRSVLAYLVKPISRAFGGALNER